MDLPRETNENKCKIPRRGVDFVQFNVIEARHGISPGHNRGSHSRFLEWNSGAANCSSPGVGDNTGGGSSVSLLLSSWQKILGLERGEGKSCCNTAAGNRENPWSR